MNINDKQPSSLCWIDGNWGDLKYKPVKENHKRMKIFVQQDINFLPKECKDIRLNFGIDFTYGVATISAKFFSLAILNSYIANPNLDIVIKMFNTANESVLLKEGTELCQVIYHN